MIEIKQISANQSSIQLWEWGKSFLTKNNIKFFLNQSQKIVVCFHMKPKPKINFPNFPN